MRPLQVTRIVQAAAEQWRSIWHCAKPDEYPPNLTIKEDPPRLCGVCIAARHESTSIRGGEHRRVFIARVPQAHHSAAVAMLSKHDGEAMSTAARFANIVVQHQTKLTA